MRIRFIARDPVRTEAPKPATGELVERSAFVPAALSQPATHDRRRSLLSTGERPLPSFEPSAALSSSPRTRSSESTATPPPPRREQPTAPPPFVPTVRLPVEVPTIETNPTLKSQVRPTYPSRCQRDGHEGTVEFELSIEADGSVASATLLQSSGCRDLDRSARRTALQLRYTPATRSGVPIAGTVRWRVNFRMGDE